MREMREWELIVASADFERGQRASKSLNQLNAADSRLLWLLTSQGPQTMRQVSEALGLEQSTVNRQVNAALARGLVERLGYRSNGARTLGATAAGQGMLEADLGRRTTVFAAGLNALPAGARDDFVRNFRVFAEAYAEAAEQQVQREGVRSRDAVSR
ncbi:Transcriptional regulator [Rhodococcus ruber BKS 20-38]|uniref:Transcriptional regulator n=1 Tax=Rhodococcus ruber BKS 20-38 TaxID=1278076 RepID=M2Y2Y1_9NOCA|nr:MarR family transcriptional regulator [Rhodococcus ruber]EME67441.1 Transcriptional regulator [Rhodococcus ruber BKS 20-38]